MWIIPIAFNAFFATFPISLVGVGSRILGSANLLIRSIHSRFDIDLEFVVFLLIPKLVKLRLEVLLRVKVCSWEELRKKLNIIGQHSS